MPETTFSPAPWGFHETTPIIIHDKDFNGLCSVIGRTFGEAGTARAFANAYLIAAAPEMYEALLIIEDSINYMKNEQGSDLIISKAEIEIIIQALSKARGQIVKHT